MKKINQLQILHLSVSVENKPVLHDINLEVKPGEVHAIMGPNGSGKSTLAYALMGHPLYQMAGGRRQKADQLKIMLDGIDITELPTEARAKAGLFLAMQSPIAVPGVSVLNLLREAYQEIYAGSQKQLDTSVENPVLARRFTVADLSITEFMTRITNFARKLAISDTILSRGIHDGFSGGERKKVEMLEALILKPKYAIFDEIDTGLDVDALKTVASGIGLLQKQHCGIIIITHYQRILKYIKPDVVHILVNGRIVKTGGAELAKQIEADGYKKYL
jgi:Fe-S cluster assembly ATP-binding protein